jgi:DNA polymerase-4
MENLLSLSAEQCGHAWGSVWGERLWHWLRGEDFEMGEVEHPKSVGHQHVLAPEMRTIERAWSVAHKLLHKAAIRLRSGDLWASRISMAASFLPEEVGESDTRPDDKPAASNGMSGRFGWYSPKGPAGRRGWSAELKLSECQDSETLIHALKKLWESRPRGPEYARPYFIGVQLSELVPSPLHSLGLFSELDGDQRRANLSAAMDELNERYGLATVAPAAMMAAVSEGAAPTRIAFTTIPDLF